MYIEYIRVFVIFRKNFIIFCLCILYYDEYLFFLKLMIKEISVGIEGDIELGD